MKGKLQSVSGREKGGQRMASKGISWASMMRALSSRRGPKVSDRGKSRGLRACRAHAPFPTAVPRFDSFIGGRMKEHPEDRLTWVQPLKGSLV